VKDASVFQDITGVDESQWDKPVGGAFEMLRNTYSAWKTCKTARAKQALLRYCREVARVSRYGSGAQLFGKLCSMSELDALEWLRSSSEKLGGGVDSTAKILFRK